MYSSRVLRFASACCAALAAALVPAAGARAADPTRPPNLVLILADDLGAAELGCYGHPQHRTPRLDALAGQGVKFETAYTAPICHPTRVMLLTGQYGCHNGVFNFPRMRGGPERENEGPDDMRSHVTLAQLLQQRGYATAMAGKWQLSGRPPGLIHECGFDEYCCWAYQEYYAPAELAAASQAGIRFRSRYWHPSVIRDERWVPTTADDYGPDLWNRYAIDFIGRHRQRPFFLFYSMCLTHNPWHPTPDSLKSPAEKEAQGPRHFAANVEYVDRLVGRVIDALDEWGLRDDTIVIFTADNGTRGRGKGQPTELGARVPLIVAGPSRVLARGSTGELADLSDMLPTLVELAGGEVPRDRPIDGHSLVPFLTGQSEQTREWIFSFIGDRRILRTQRYLLEDNSLRHWGRLYDCGDARDGRGYREVTEADTPEVLAVKRQFDELLAGLPAPVLDFDGPATGPRQPRP